jgi:hypothetical protein
MTSHHRVCAVALAVAVMVFAAGCKLRRTSSSTTSSVAVSDTSSAATTAASPDTSSDTASAASAATSASAASGSSAALVGDAATKGSAVEGDTGPVFVTRDGHYRLRAPGWMTEKSQDSRNVLRIVRGNETMNLYEEKKMDFAANNLDEFVAHEMSVKKKNKQTPLGAIAKLTIAGRPARQTEVDVIMDEKRWRELYTCIEFADEYVEVSAVVAPSKYDRAPMAAIVQTVETTRP